jgi:hypothetical protein
MNPFKFSSLWAFIPISYLLLFLPQSVIGIFYLDGGIALEVIKIFLLGLIAYLAGYQIIKYFLLKYSGPKFWIIELSEKKFFIFTCFIFTIYFFLLFYVALTSERVPLWEALSGASSLEIAQSREMLFHSQFGMGRSLIYLYSILTSAFIPYLLMIFFINKTKLAWLFYIAYYLSLLVPMEKALFIKAFLPFFLIAANGYLSRRTLWVSLLAALFILSSMGYLARGRDNGESHGAPNQNISNTSEWELNQCINIFQNGKCLSRIEHSKKYYPLINYGVMGYLVNRALWIPYVTGYDWIEYFQNRLRSGHTEGRTSTLVSKLLGKERIPMEQFVFDYQFGLGATQFAGANANFMIDGYVNFGMIGVILISSFMGFFIAVIEQLKNPAACACIYLFLFQLLGGGFLGTFFGGGLLLFLLLIYFFRPKISPINSLSIVK